MVMTIINSAVLISYMIAMITGMWSIKTIVKNAGKLSFCANWLTFGFSIVFAISYFELMMAHEGELTHTRVDRISGFSHLGFNIGVILFHIRDIRTLSGNENG